jgi:hypothetical protein
LRRVSRLPDVFVLHLAAERLRPRGLRRIVGDLLPEVDGQLFVADAEADGRKREGGIRVRLELGQIRW